MSDSYTNEPMLDMFIFETSQQIEQLENIIINGEKEKTFTSEEINEIFRIMHTMKGSAAMMMFQSISTLAHSMEDIFYFVREEKPQNLDFSALSDLVLEGIDFIKVEIEKIKNQDQPDGNPTIIQDSLGKLLLHLKGGTSESSTIEAVSDSNAKQYYISKDKERVYHNTFHAVLFFQEGCEMENIRAYTVVHNLGEITDQLSYLPEDILENEESINVIRKDGFQITIKTDYTYEMLHEFLMKTIFLEELKLTKIDDAVQNQNAKEHPGVNLQQNIISVSVQKLDKLMDLVGEMVISEAMVIQNPDLEGLEIVNFEKAARQLNKITNEIQDIVMSVRMVPLSVTFQKMRRIVRDMSKKLGKNVELSMIGEDTEVDKNIIEHISDPLMHLVRNAIDHGLENNEERKKLGKSQTGTVTLEAKNAGNDVFIIVRDDGKGLDQKKIIKKAKENGLMRKDESVMTEKEINNLILLPGFSTNDAITEYSGRGVGMDVVVKNIETIGGTVSVESIPGEGTGIMLKIPLTLAIIDGMNIRVGKACYTLPTTSIKESFRPKESDIIIDPDGNESIMVRGKCYSILRLHQFHKVENGVTDITKGIFVMVELEEKAICIFADELIGQQQVVVKTLPKFIQKFQIKKGVAGCTLLGDGSISLILDISGLLNM